MTQVTTLTALLQEIEQGLPPGSVEQTRTGIAVATTSRNELFRKLRERGYAVRKVQKSHGDGWYAELRADIFQTKGKCGHCGALIEVRGIYAHGRDCEACGKPVCREYVDGGEIGFAFVSDLRRGVGSAYYPTMRIKRYDPSIENKNVGELVLYADPIKGPYDYSMEPDEARKVLAEHESEIRRFTEDGVDYIGIRYTRPIVDIIDTHDLSGGWKKASVVKIYRDKEYKEHGDPLPVPESISISEKN